MIYESGTPEKAAVYGIWGYWITLEELLASIILLGVLVMVAITVTNNPTPEAVIEQLECKDEKKRKYLE